MIDDRLPARGDSCAYVKPTCDGEIWPCLLEKAFAKYDKNGEVNERDIDEEKAESAAIFEEKWKTVREDEDYLKLKKAHQKKYG